MSPSLRLSFEVFPPPAGQDDGALWRTLDSLAPFRPRFVSVTYGAGGSSRNRSDRIVRAIRARTGLEPAAHLTCIGAGRAEIDRTADRWLHAGIRHIVALRGDPPANAAGQPPHPEGYRNAAELVAGLRRIGEFSIAVAAYPECHPESESPQADLDNLKRKIDAGANCAITQFFFEPSVFLRFRDRARAEGIKVPIVPGILPITNFARAVRFARACAATVPDWLSELYSGLDDDAETRSLVAAAQATELCQRLQSEGIGEFHFYTLNRPALTAAICRRLEVRLPLDRAA